MLEKIMYYYITLKAKLITKLKHRSDRYIYK